MDLQSGQTYDGGGKSVDGGGQQWQYSGLHDVTLVNWDFRNVQIKLTDCQRITFSRCSFHDVVGRCIDMYGQLPGISVTQCSFKNVSADSCLFLNNGQLVDGVFSDNLFDTVTHGMHFSWGGTKQRNDCRIQRNVFLRVQRFALEMQNGVTGLLITNNYADAFRPNTSRMAYSLALGPIDGVTKALGGTGLEVRDNWFGDPARQGSADAFAVCELMGIGAKFHHNAAVGPYGALVLDGWDDPSTQVHDCVFSGGTDMAHIIKEESQGVHPAAANVYGNLFPATLPAPASPDLVTQGRMWWQTTGSGTTIAPAVVVDPNAPSMIATPRANTAGIVDIVLRNTPAGRVQRQSSHGGEGWADVTPVVAGAPTAALADAGPANGAAMLQRNWEYDWRLLDASGAVVATCSAQVLDLPYPPAVIAAFNAAQAPIVGVDVAGLQAILAQLNAQSVALQAEIARLEAA